MKFPPHEGSLMLVHNQPRDCYETVAQACEGDNYYAHSKWVSLEQRLKAIETNGVWTLHWYPRTPVGFIVLHACDLDVLLEAASA